MCFMVFQGVSMNILLFFNCGSRFSQTIVSRVFWKIEGDLKKKFQNCFTILSGGLDGCSMAVSIVFNPTSYGLSESVVPMGVLRGPPSYINEGVIFDPMLR